MIALAHIRATHRAAPRIGLALAALMALPGCGKESARTPDAPRDQATDAKPSVGREQDVATLNEFLRQQPAQQPAARSAAPAGGASGADPASSAGLPPGHPPIGVAPSGAPSGAPSAAPPAAALVELKYDVPEGWQPRPPRSGMRKAEFFIPRAPGDPDDGSMVLFYFGKGEGGSVQANLDRWKGMFTTADGAAVPDAAVWSTTIDANGLKVTLLDVVGRYADPMSPTGRGAGPTQSDYRMLAAIVETPDGPWFFKGVGPAETMAAQREAFMQMMRSVRRSE